MVMALGFILGSYLRFSTLELKLSEETMLSNVALNLAEGGAEEAIWSLTRLDWTDWTEYSDYAVREINDLDLGQGKTGRIRIILENHLSSGITSPTILSEGYVVSDNGLKALRQIRIVLENRSPFANGLTAKESLTINGGTARIDSYDSAYGTWDSLLNRGDGGTVGTTSLNFGDLDAGNSEIYGYVATGGGTPAFGPNAKVYGEDWAVGDPDIDSDRVALDFTADLPDVDAPSMSSSAKDDSDADIVNLTGGGSILSGVLANTVTISGGTPDAPLEYHLTSFEMDNKKKLVIDNDSYVVMRVDGDVDINELDVSAGAQLTMYVNGNFTISGSDYANANPDASSFVIYGTNNTETKSFTLNGSASMIASVYAPNADLTINGGGNGDGFSGAAVAKTIELNGGVDYHYDEALAVYGGIGSFMMDEWEELITPADRFDFEAYATP